MPMALIAVALLIAGAFYGVVYAGIEHGTDNADSANVEFGTVDDALERARMTLRAELGTIITTVSSASYGTLIDRSGTFGELTERMLEERFPNTYKGVTTEIEGHNLTLGLKTMRMEGTGIADNVTRASYLAVSGTVSLLLTSESTTTRKTIPIEADATSALPLVAESSTMFELSVEGGGSVLCQMVEYQLNSLASNRILNGYGQRSSVGDFGTSSIITQEDVHRAVRNALNIVEAMYFRDCPDGNLLTHVCADLGEMIVLQDGCLVIDLGALFSQALMQRVDEYAIQWIEYIGLDTVLDLLDSLCDGLHTLVNFFKGLISGEDPDKKEAVNYIKKQMSNLGYDDGSYRYFTSSVLNEDLTYGPMEYTLHVDDDAEIRYTETCTIPLKAGKLDLLDWDGWGDFMKDYRKKTNQFKETLMAVLKTVAMSACSGSVVKIPLDVFDRESYAQELTRCVEEGINGALDRFIDGSVNTVRDSGISDPVMAEMYRTIQDKSDEIFKTHVLDGIEYEIAKYIALDSDWIHANLIAEQIRDRINVGDLKERYVAEVDQYVDSLSIFLDAKKKGSIAIGLAATVGSFLRGLHLEDYVRGTSLNLAEEMAAAAMVSPYSTVPDLPGTDAFVLEDSDGTIHTEKLKVIDTAHMDVSIVDPVHNRGKNTHYIGIFEDRTARYSSVFTVRIAGCVEYTVSSTNPFYDKLALSDCIYTGCVDVDISMDIACMSGWALTGVQYEKSNTVFGDISEGLRLFFAKLFERLTAPMDQVMRGLEFLRNICSTAMVEYGNFMNEMIQRFYEAVSIPMGYLEDVMDDVIQDILSDISLEDICIMLGSQTFVFNVFGMKVTVETDVRSLEKATKNYVKVTAERDLGNGSTLSATMALKEKPSLGRFVTVSAGASGGDWAFSLELDPMFSSGTHYATVTGHIRDVEYSGAIPELVQYQIIDVSTDDIPGVRETLNNIVLPAIGYKASLEIGLYAKYDLPVETGLLINEVELNPAGNDSDSEWVELYNNTDSSIDILGYTLVPSGADKRSVSIGDIVLGPHERTVIYFQGQALKNDTGTRITLYDTYGREVDRTPSLKDRENSDHTWQRTTDGSVNWSFMSGTEDSKNNGDYPGGMMLKTVLIDFAKEAAVEVLDEMGDRVEGSEMALEYAQRVVARIVEKFIDCVAKCLVEACAFVKFELTDYSQSQHYGMKVMLGVDSELISDVLRYIASMIPVIGEHISCPQGLTAVDFLYKDVFLRTMVYTGMSAPKFLGAALDDTEVDVAISVRVNISAISNLFGDDRGDWKAVAGIVMENIPTEMVPECFHPRDYMKSDLWLFRMTFTRWSAGE